MRSFVILLFIAAAVAFTSAGVAPSTSEPIKVLTGEQPFKIEAADYGCPDHAVCDYYCRSFGRRGGYCAPCPYNGVCYCWTS